jgi:hypothetical protein
MQARAAYVTPRRPLMHGRRQGDLIILCNARRLRFRALRIFAPVRFRTSAQITTANPVRRRDWAIHYAIFHARVSSMSWASQRK